MKKAQTFKKALSMLMVILMCVCFLGTSALAADSYSSNKADLRNATTPELEQPLYNGTITLAYPTSKYLHTIQNLTSLTYTGYSKSGNEELLWLQFTDSQHNYTYKYSFLLDGNAHTLSVNIEPGTYTISQIYISGGSLQSISLRFYY